MYTLFNLSEKVRVKDTEKVGEITQCRTIKRYRDGKTEEVTHYFINFVGYMNDWYLEEDLESESIKVREFSEKFELDLLNFMIDVSLDNANYTHVKYLNEQRQQYLKKAR